MNMFNILMSAISITVAGCAIMLLIVGTYYEIKKIVNKNKKDAK